MDAFGKTFASRCFFRVWRTSVYLCFSLAGLDSFSARSADAAQEAKGEVLLSKAGAAYARGNRDEAILLATEAIEAEPNEVRGYLVRARLQSEALLDMRGQCGMVRAELAFARRIIQWIADDNDDAIR